MKVDILLLICALLLWTSTLTGQDTWHAKLCSENIQLDGQLNESCWKEALVCDEMISFLPEFGQTLPYRTEVYLTYNRDNLFIAFQCFDPNPENIKGTITARDQIKMEDWVCVNMDPFNDQQSLLAFYSNPLGIQMDSRSSANQEDLGADFVFHTKGKRTDTGYTVEMQIPFKSLRYNRKKPVVMGMIFERRIHHLSTQGTYPPLDPQKGMNFLTQMKPIVLENIEHYTLLEILPALTYSRLLQASSGSLNVTRSRPEFSLTGKVGLSSQLSLDLTYNPDFSQVESDAGQIEENQRYSLFYKEKRPFFQEGKESFSIAAVSEHGSFQSVVHTRQIANPLVGAKLSGKISNKSRLAILYSLDENHAFADSSGRYSNFMIGRYQYALNKDSYLGLAMTTREDPDQYNRLAGADGRFRLGDESAIEFNVFGSLSTTPNDKSKNGLIGTVSYNKENEKNSVRFELQHIGQDFITRAGYLQRNGINRLSLSYKPNFYFDQSFFRKVSIMSFGILSEDIPSGLLEHDLGLGTEVAGNRSSTFITFINLSSEVYLHKRFNTNSYHLIGMSQILPKLLINVDYRFGNSIRYVSDPYSGYGNKGNLMLNYQPITNFQTGLTITYADFYRHSDQLKDFDYTILRFKNTYQVNKYLFFRIILEYNTFEEALTADALASFTYIPGTVIHLGYGSLYNQKSWTGHEYQPGDKWTEMTRGLFFKASYLFRN